MIDYNKTVGRLLEYLMAEVDRLEFDQANTAAIEPSNVYKPLSTMPKAVVLCFFQEAIGKLCGDGKAVVLGGIHSEVGDSPIYELELDGERVAVVHPGVGAPFAAGSLEELIVLGGRYFVACGSSGVLDSALPVGQVLLPSHAIRDEGTSYHYLPPSREVAANQSAIKIIMKVLTEHGIPYTTVKTWTTDAIYRETPARIARRKAEGCLTVEMEAAAFFAVAQFRKVSFAQLLYAGDDVSGPKWDIRNFKAHFS